MKKIITYLALISPAFFYSACDKPAPTELIQDEEQYQIEQITNDFENSAFDGYDTTGITQNITELNNLIVVNGTKITKSSGTEEISLAQAFFFNKNSPVYDREGNLIAYNAIAPGDLMIDGFRTHKIPYKLRYRFNNTISDTIIGLQYVLSGKGNSQGRRFNFRYNSNINFQMDIINSESVNFSFPTPHEVTANLRKDREVGFLLEWNRENYRNFELVIGAINRITEKHIPLYRIKTEDDGSFILPAKLLNAIPKDRFNFLVFTLIRKIDYYHENGNNKLYILSQSIHSIISNIP